MYEFRLTPAYCLFNGIAILEQHGSEAMFLLENPEDVVLKGRVKRAFASYLENVVMRDDCPDFYKQKMHVDFIKGSREQLRRCVSGLYKTSDVEEIKTGINIDRYQKEAAAVLLLDSILHDAKEKKATDIHIEKNTVRFRISGVLEKQMDIGREHGEELIQRIKLLAGMNVIEKRKSQDGRFVYGKNNPIFVRVSEVIVIGEKSEGVESLVLRILDTSRVPLTINKLGFNEKQLLQIGELEKIKNGLVLVCGPTGSGKSTTIASILVEMETLYKNSIKIISLEDPPEYIIPGVSQIQIDEKNGNSYYEILSHIFRQDPDVIMIGEIRDERSAAVALRAALTGHLVFATLHTGGAGEAVLRLENLGLERRLLASVLRASICQELNYMEETASICADIAIPKEKFGQKLTKEMCEQEIDELFDHCTNYSEFLSASLIQMSKKIVLPEYETKNQIKRKQLLLVSGNGTKIHEKIG